MKSMKKEVQFLVETPALLSPFQSNIRSNSLMQHRKDESLFLKQIYTTRQATPVLSAALVTPEAEEEIQKWFNLPATTTTLACFELDSIDNCTNISNNVSSDDDMVVAADSCCGKNRSASTFSDCSSSSYLSQISESSQTYATFESKKPEEVKLCNLEDSIITESEDKFTELLILHDTNNIKLSPALAAILNNMQPNAGVKVPGKRGRKRKIVEVIEN